MVHIEGSVVICRPIEDVFAVVADPTLEPRYNAIMTRSEKVTPGPVRVGTRFRDVTKGFGGGEMTVEVTEIMPHANARNGLCHWGDESGGSATGNRMRLSRAA